MDIVKRITYGNEIPRGYGVAIHDFLNYYAVCYPIPLHLVVRVADRIWWRIKHPKPLDRQAELAEAYNKGFQDGHEQALDTIEQRLGYALENVEQWIDSSDAEP